MSRDLSDDRNSGKMYRQSFGFLLETQHLGLTEPSRFPLDGARPRELYETTTISAFSNNR